MAGREGSGRQGRGGEEVSRRHVVGACERRRAGQERQKGGNAGKPEGQGRAGRKGRRGRTATNRCNTSRIE